MTGTVAAEEITTRIVRLRQTLPETVRLIAVTKTMPATAVRAAYAAGIRDFGESRVQEAIAKQADLSDLPDLTWHLIGHLQTNKARKALEHFQWIHSVDSLKLAEKLNQLAEDLPQAPTCCLQVKLADDPAKSGFLRDQLWTQLADLNQLTHLNIVGLMTIPPYGLTQAATEAVFRQARDLAAQINSAQWEHIHIRELSMGMSGDYALAIAAGSTMIRLGTILFGDRT